MHSANLLQYGKRGEAERETVVFLLATAEHQLQSCTQISPSTGPKCKTLGQNI